MKKLLSLPPNLVGSFHEIAGVGPVDWFCTSDPVGGRLGSGGGTTWLLEACRKDEDPAGMLTIGEWRVKNGFYCMPEGRAGVCPGTRLRVKY